MALYRIMCTLQDRSGLSKDRYVNTFYVASITPLTDPEATLSSVNTAFGTFYQRLAVHFGSIVGGDGHTVKAYDMSLPPNGRVPIGTATFDLTAATSTSFPSEVALALTLESTPIAGVAPQSTRGRVFMGPLGVVDSTGGTSGVGTRPSQALIDAILESFGTLYDIIPQVSPGLSIVIASTIHGKVKLAAGARHAYQVTSFSVDNAYDTQRSRGNAPTARTRTTKLTVPAFDLTW